MKFISIPFSISWHIESFLGIRTAGKGVLDVQLLSEWSSRWEIVAGVRPLSFATRQLLAHPTEEEENDECGRKGGNHFFIQPGVDLWKMIAAGLANQWDLITKALLMYASNL